MAVLVVWPTAAIASFPIVYVKLPTDLLLGALANLGVGWARRWMDFVQNSSIGKLLELSGQTQVQNQIMKLFEPRISHVITSKVSLIDI